jgi:hypothetical protein
MLLMEAAGTNYRDPANKGTEGLSDIIVAEEGSAILMWALEACVADYCTPGLFNELMEEPRKAAREYAKEDSTIQQWAAHEMREHPDADVDALEAIERYLDFCKRISGGKAPHIKMSGFKAAVKAAFPSISFGNRTKGPHKNRVYIRGFGFAQPDFSEAGNVVQLHQPQPETPASTTEEK